MLAASPVFSQFSGGSGVAGDEYLIGSKDDIYALIDSINAEPENNKFIDKHYKVIKNIRDSVRKPIPFFSGSWNGNGYKVTLAIKNYQKPTEYGKFGHYQNDVGLFAYILDAKISNIVVAGYVFSDSGYMQFIGGIAGFTETTEIYNCINLAKITSDHSCVGGIVGHTGYLKLDLYKITNSVNLGTINAVRSSDTNRIDKISCIGGIIGHTMQHSFVKNTINAGFINAMESISYSAGRKLVSGIVGGSGKVDGTINIFNSINVGIIKEKEDRINGITNK